MKATFVLSFLSIAAAYASTSSRPSYGSRRWTIGQTVNTTSGSVKGHTATWTGNEAVSEYLGIPYATPPLGALRFAAPTPFKPNSSAVFDASKFSNDCMQYIGNAASTTLASPALIAYGAAMGGGSATNPHTYSEDCLGMNVWTKAQTGEKAKAVLMWIYGGAFSTGTSNAPFYNGARLANEEDVVVVSFNYRVNIFGFPRAPGLSDENVGLLDQRLAVQWVRDNIAAFGGDPKRITLFGESAGGFSVDYYAYAWTEEPIVNGFIAESGTALVPQAAAPGGISTDPYADWYNVSQALGCGGANSSTNTLECMRQKPAMDIMNYVGQMSASVSTSFSPMPDGKVVFNDTLSRASTGKFIKVPMLVGNNDNELGITQVLPTSLGPLGSSLNSSDAREIGNNIAFSCPAGEAAEARVKNGVKAWRYRYMSVWDNTALAPGIGAYHSSEIPLVFGATELKPNATKDVPEEAKLSKVIRHAWAEFAKDPEMGLVALKWPVYNPNGTTLIRLGYQNSSALNLAVGTQYDSQCASLGAVLPSANSTAAVSSVAARSVLDFKKNAFRWS